MTIGVKIERPSAKLLMIKISRSEEATKTTTEKATIEVDIVITTIKATATITRGAITKELRTRMINGQKVVIDLNNKSEVETTAVGATKTSEVATKNAVIVLTLRPTRIVN